MKLTDKQAKWLNWLKERGGSGYLDAYGRVVAGGEVSPQGAMVCWMKMIAGGYVRGGDDRLSVVELPETACMECDIIGKRNCSAHCAPLEVE